MPDETRFSLRVPRDLHALLLERAAAEHRSLNAQIIHLLWQAFTVDADAYRGARNQRL
jgi:predicted HicB family RNase H-like nuclease